MRLRSVSTPAVILALVALGFYLASLLQGLDGQETLVMVPSRLSPGSPASVRVVVRSVRTRDPIVGAAVEVRLGDAAVFQGATGARGTVDGSWKVPDLPPGEADLVVRVHSLVGQDEVRRKVQLQRVVRTLLTTDRPLYQPGQTVHMRALALDRVAGRAVESGEVQFEVQDPKGNRVFRRKVQLQAFGVASVDFPLASEVLQGEYRISCTVGERTTERTVRVERYALPKFKVEMETERADYRPGETVRGMLSARYFFGKPVESGNVRLDASTFDVSFRRFARVTGRTGPDGRLAFEVPLPDHFVGLPLEQGRGLLRLEAAVLDGAGHQEQAARMLQVATGDEAPLAPGPPTPGGPRVRLDLIPERAQPAPGLPNRFFVVTTQHGGDPAPGCRVVVRVGNQRAEVVTDASGLAEFETVPSGYLAFDVQAFRGEERLARGSFPEIPAYDLEPILLRPERSLCRVGETLTVNVLSTRKQGTVHLDAVREGQTVLTRTLQLEGGRAQAELELTADLAGSLDLHAYQFDGWSLGSRDARTVLVQPAEDLAVTMRPDRSEYRPGDTARLEFAVRDRSGRPAEAALGLQIADESLLALAEEHPGLEKVYFALQERLLAPDLEVCHDNRAVAPASVVAGDGADPALQRAARALFAVFQEPAGGGVLVNAWLEKSHARRRVAEELRMGALTMMTLLFVYLVWVWTSREGCVPTVLVGATLALAVAILVPNFIRARAQGQFTACKSNLKNVGTALEMYSTDWSGRYPTDLQRLVPQYLKTLPLCPTAGRDTYSEGYRSTANPDSYFLCCLGPNHVDQGFPPDCPTYNSVQGLIEKGDVGDTRPAMPVDQALPPEAPPAPLSLRGVRLRQHFPETMYWNPLVRTGADGTARVEVPVADALTTWRVTAQASTRAGLLGSLRAPLRVFQPFFLEPDVPAALTRGDVVHVPVAVYNYLPSRQEVTVEVEPADWFRSAGPLRRTVALEPGSVAAVRFPLEVTRVGQHRLTVVGLAQGIRDAVARPVRVAPEGREVTQAHAGHLSGAVSVRVTFPRDAVAGANALAVRLYPDRFSEVLDGLEGLLRMPHGCFEQTSSVTYPNVMVLRYLRESGRALPEVQAKAESLIATGYQRLLTFEVPEGGFDWFGTPPGKLVLTAYGLLQFHDMDRVAPVDPAVLDRTRRWILAQQREDGSFPVGAGLHDGLGGDAVVTTAYTTWALLESGERGAEVDRALDWLLLHAGDDPYVQALLTNCLVLRRPEDEATRVHLERLRATRSRGVEVTALTVQALHRAGGHGAEVIAGLRALAAARREGGDWGTTQATILALRALVETAGADARETGKLQVQLDGRSVGSLTLDAESAGVVQVLDLGRDASPGEHRLELIAQEGLSVPYQVVARHWLPGRPAAASGPFDLSVDYDRTELATEDLVTATVRVRNRQSAPAPMVMVDVGVPPGFTVLAGDLAGQPDVARHELTSRQLLLYLRGLGPGRTVEARYRLKARFPLRAASPGSSAYEYYAPAVRVDVPGREFLVR